eukprot:1534432-Alexandrium_andersonii.AAC.1
MAAARQGEWGGFHGGFVCTSFSRARFRPAPGMPGPVRSARHIYGFPDNAPKQRREAEEGNAMAIRTIQLAQVVAEEAVKRGREPVATAENPAPPLDNDELPSAFYLPE